MSDEKSDLPVVYDSNGFPNTITMTQSSPSEIPIYPPFVDCVTPADMTHYPIVIDWGTPPVMTCSVLIDSPSCVVPYTQASIDSTSELDNVKKELEETKCELEALRKKTRTFTPCSEVFFEPGK